MTQHIVCYSGGHSSALVALEVAEKHGVGNLTLLNHDIAAHVEDEDIKRFKREVAAHLGLPVNYANYMDSEPVTADQFDVTVKAGAFKVDDGPELCTDRLKTRPFMAWLKANADPADSVIYYGFDANEQTRIQRRIGILGADGWRTDYPLALWPRTIYGTEEIGIARPLTYSAFKHANCVGCLKAGWQHWYIVYCTRPDIWAKGKWAEEEIGYAIHHDTSGPVYLEDMEPHFEAMRLAGIPATEHIPQQRFWAQANRIVRIAQIQSSIPCECM
jgi:hypothetical protein